MRVAPPTSTTLSIWWACTLASVECLVQAGERLQKQGSDQLFVVEPCDLLHKIEGFIFLLRDELFLDRGDGLE